MIHSLENKLKQLAVTGHISTPLQTTHNALSVPPDQKRWFLQGPATIMWSLGLPALRSLTANPPAYPSPSGPPSHRWSRHIETDNKEVDDTAERLIQ
ncbi:hypothetical protein DPEC_G00076670 [Dallia pectoralis]|uniref:Uncharacterized protein n=1 Tax=Dallia pectoralis TaxID=75939 RepID=A0ACC2H3U1_DALPE|nr:hypothetical protein DPEC_G00076670 [Dallia pectoralis]